MPLEKHFRALERLYLKAPINRIFKPRIRISQGSAEIEMPLTCDMHHAADAVHGCVYFKMLDDAAFFAANSVESEVFMLTAAFTTYLTQPILEGHMRALGNVVNQTRSQIIAEAVAYDEHQKEIARGHGIFIKSKRPLVNIPNYTLK